MKNNKLMEVVDFLEVVETKVCKRCNKEKIITDFCKKTKNKDGRHIYCKECENPLKAEYRKTHKEQAKKYRDTHKKNQKTYMKRYWKENKDKLAKYQINKYYSNIKFRILVSSRNRIGKYLKGISKSEHTKELLGCSLEELKTHLENKFKNGMSWNNYGKNGWEIDHIIPCCSFDLTDLEQRKKCFHYTNLQPLWAIENRIKWNKILN